MTERQAYIAFNLTDKVGVATLTTLKEKFGSAVRAWENYPSKVSRTGGEIDWNAEEKLAKKYGVRIVTLIDPDYPERLRLSPGAPLVLYVKGSVAALSKPFVAMIGTRRATTYGRAIASHLAEDLVAAGWSILSGLALGIDAASHQGALAGKGVTVGVIGSGLDRFYPEENRELAREIVASGGAVVSQFPFGRSADTTTFPIRNHIVAALATGVIAVECPMKSGTLITTGFAAELGRTVMAVPAAVDHRMSAGCLHLIREGATLIRNVDDVLEALNGFLPRAESAAEASPETLDPETPAYSPKEALLMLELDSEGKTVDELARRTKFSVSEVNSLAMGLRIKGFIRFLPGNRIALS